MLDFTDKTVVVTGAANGIGRACAAAFAAAGGRVVLSDIDAAACDRAAGAIAGETGAEVASFECDVANDDACAGLVKKSCDRFEKIDVLINNAGVIMKGGVLDLDPNDFDRVLSVNLRSYFVLTQLVARGMVERKTQGSIIMMSSLNSILAIPDQLAYVTSKGGLQQLTKAAALGLAEHGVRVNAIGPGSIMTDILRVVMNDDAARHKILSRTPMGRVGEPEEIASVALFLASDMASYITGQTIFPDGGRSALNYTAPVHE